MIAASATTLAFVYAFNDTRLGLHYRSKVGRYIDTALFGNYQLSFFQQCCKPGQSPTRISRHAGIQCTMVIHGDITWTNWSVFSTLSTAWQQQKLIIPKTGKMSSVRVSVPPTNMTTVRRGVPDSGHTGFRVVTVTGYRSAQACNFIKYIISIWLTHIFSSTKPALTNRLLKTAYLQE